eukprot:3495095-Amphidinium_carterae.1
MLKVQTERERRSRFAARVGLTQEQVQVSRDQGLLQPVGQTTSAEGQTVARGATSASAVSGIAAVSGLPDQGSGTASGSVPGAARGLAPETTRSSTTRTAEELEEDDQEAHKFIRLEDEEETVATLWGSERISIVGEVTNVKVAVPMEKNHLDYRHISPSDYYNLVDEDTGEPLDAQKVAEGVNRVMKFLDEQRLGEPVLRRTVRSVIWTARWVHRIKGDGVRSRYVARQFKNATEEVESDVYAATPRLETIRLLLAWALVNKYEIRTGDFS